MLMLFCVQVVQTNNNESSFFFFLKQQFFILNKQKICELVKKIKIYNLKNLVNKIYNKLKFIIDRLIKTSRNHNLFQV